ncbi:MAG: hypothetical protein RLZZ292_1048 [Bacteroidota bacterium]|jgi:hypothetical protein
MKSLKNKLLLFLLFFSLMVLASCTSKKPTVFENKTETITIKETVRDTVFKIEKDSSSYRALIACQNGKVVIKEVTQAESGRTLNSPRVRLDNGLLKIDCHAKAQELLAHYINTHKTTNQIVTKTIEVNKLTTWQALQIWVGRVLFFSLTVFSTLFLIEKYKKT